MKKTHMSFDLDGTLVDSFAVMREAWREVCQDFGLTIPFEQYRMHIGLPFDKIMENLGLRHATSDISKRYFSYTRENYGNVKLFPVATSVLSTLKKSGITVSIITSKPRENAEHLLNKLGLPFDLLLCGDDLATGKPSSLPMVTALAALDSTADETLYVGDMLSDLQFAINSRVDFALFCGGEYSDMPSTVLNPYIKISKLDELLAYVYK